MKSLDLVSSGFHQTVFYQRKQAIPIKLA